MVTSVPRLLEVFTVQCGILCSIASCIVIRGIRQHTASRCGFGLHLGATFCCIGLGSCFFYYITVHRIYLDVDQFISCYTHCSSY